MNGLTFATPHVGARVPKHAIRAVQALFARYGCALDVLGAVRLLAARDYQSVLAAVVAEGSRGGDVSIDAIEAVLRRTQRPPNRSRRLR